MTFKLIGRNTKGMGIIPAFYLDAGVDTPGIEIDIRIFGRATRKLARHLLKKRTYLLRDAPVTELVPSGRGF